MAIASGLPTYAAEWFVVREGFDFGGGRKGTAPAGSEGGAPNGPQPTPIVAQALRWIPANNCRLTACMLVAACVSPCAFALPSSSVARVPAAINTVELQADPALYKPGEAFYNRTMSLKEERSSAAR